MAFLREGLDKIMFTIMPKKGDKRLKYRYCKSTETKHFDSITKLKFGDRYANVILFERYPWQTWEREGVRKSTFGVRYFLRIDGFRQMRILLNCQRMYNILNKLEVYDKRLFDDNVVVPSEAYYLEEFIEIVQDRIHEFMSDYIRYRNEIFGDELTNDDLVLYTHQVEMVREGVGLHTSDVSELFKRHSRADSITVYHDQVNTHYFNTHAKRQLKMYQKGVGILRLEATFNDRPHDVVWNWSGPSTHIADSLRSEFDRLLLTMNIPEEWWKTRIMSRDKFIWSLADAIGLRTRKKHNEPSEIMDGLMKVLLHNNSWSQNPHDQDRSDYVRSEEFERLTRWLKRKGLIKTSGNRGVWLPTDRLIFIRDIYQRICKTEGWLV